MRGGRIREENHEQVAQEREEGDDVIDPDESPDDQIFRLIEERNEARRECEEAVALLRDWVRDSLDSGGNTSVAAMNFLARIDKKEKP